MKKCYSLLRWPCYYRMCSTNVYCSKQTGSSSTKAITIISSFLELGEETVDAAKKFVAAQKMLLKRNPANIRKCVARFYYPRHLYSAGSAWCIAHNNYIQGLTSIWATLSALLVYTSGFLPVVFA